MNGKGQITFIPDNARGIIDKPYQEYWHTVRGSADIQTAKWLCRKENHWQFPLSNTKAFDHNIVLLSTFVKIKINTFLWGSLSY